MQYIPWQGSPGRHAFHLIRTLCNPAWLKQPAVDMEPFSFYRAQDLLYGDKRQATVSYDKHAAYLPCLNIALGVGEPEWTRGPFSFKLPGLFHFDDDAWLWTPQAKVSRARPMEAWLWYESHHVLQPVYEYLRWWYNASEPGSGARALCKQTYTILVGLLAHQLDDPGDDAIYRPDWHNLIISECRARLEAQIARIEQTEGIRPVAVKVDCLYYTHEVNGLAVGDGIGQFKKEAV
jgi:hypothetical protein